MKQIREPSVSGTFYPSDPNVLRETIEKFFLKAKISPINEKIIAGISPHAGYIYSGQAQAYVYKAMEKIDFDLACIIAPSHQAYYEGASVYPEGFYRTPLGDVEIDNKVAEKLLKFSLFDFNLDAHIREHSVEVQLPFLQFIKKNFKFVPIVISQFDREMVKEMAENIYIATKNRNVVFIASTDLSHYPPYEIAKKVDNETIKHILSLNPEELYEFARIAPRNYHGVSTALCGEGGVLVLLNILRIMGVNKSKLLIYYNSGDVTEGIKQEVVGYSGIIFSK